MKNKLTTKKDQILEKLEYIGLDLENIPQQIKEFEPLEFRIPKFYEEKQYKQYRYVPIENIQILLSPTNRLDDLQEKYKKARPLAEYLDSENEENFIKYTTFLNMVKQVKIEDIEAIEKEQNNLNKKIPFKVKFEGNYLWQIYYSENTDKYFMIVPIKDSDYSTFFYVLKKQLENKEAEKIFVPIRNLSYSNKYLKKSEYEDIVNYLWLFTGDWPLIYEVYDNEENLSIQIIGETNVYEKIRSPYKIKINAKSEANRFYKLLKAMFILQTELPHYFKFQTNINKKGEIDFYLENTKIEYKNIPEWINYEYNLGKEKIAVAEDLIFENREKLKKLKEESAEQEIEYLAKEKQISTFLECKKTFFGKFKYYFKYSKKNKDNKIKDNKKSDIRDELNFQNIEKLNLNKEIKENDEKKENYTIEELIEIYKEYESKENELKNLLMDINALKLKNKNMKKKIENAILFIEEIDKHKKSIFEFWKFSNKYEVAALAEGEEEEVNIIKKITKVFDYEEDLEQFGNMMDKHQRKSLTKTETDSVFIATTELVEILNKVKNNEITPKEIEISLKDLKKQQKEEKELIDNEEFDIFGGVARESTKISKINNKKHREIPKDKFNILDITRNTKQIGYKLALENILDNIKRAMDKTVVVEDLPIYKAIVNDKLYGKNINIFNINPEKELKDTIKNNKEGKINFYKLNLKKEFNAISFTNIIFYDNQNRTLPVGQDLSTKMMVDLTKLKLELKSKYSFKMIEFEDEKDDFSEINIRTITVLEYDLTKKNLKNENKKDKKPIIEEPKDSKRHKVKRNKK